jgi:hypothetical protein
MSQVKVTEARVSPAMAKSVLLVCPRCSAECECVFPWGSTGEQKMKIRHDVMYEHARNCKAGEATITTVYPIAYPRL